MNVRLSILLVVILAIIGGAVAITASGGGGSTKIKENPWLYKLPSENITAISMTHKDQHVEYVKECNRWTIKDGKATPVFRDRWAGTTLLLSGPRSSRDLAPLIDDPNKYGLVSPQAKVRVTDISDEVLEFHLGDETPDGDDWYARLVASDRLFTVVSEWAKAVTSLATSPYYAPAPDRVITEVEGAVEYQGLFTLITEEIVHLAVIHNGQRMDYSLSCGKWVIKDSTNTPVSVDRWPGDSVLSEDARSDQLVIEETYDPAEYGLESPPTVLLIYDEAGRYLEIGLGDTTPDGNRRYAQLAGSDKLFTVDSSWGEVVSSLVVDPPYPPAT